MIHIGEAQAETAVEVEAIFFPVVETWR